MLKFIDNSKNEHLVEAEYSYSNGVNGEKAISGRMYSNETAIHAIGRGWKLEFEEEFYNITYALPVDEGDGIYVEFDAIHEFFYDFEKSVIYETLNGSQTFETYLNFIFKGTEYSYRNETIINAFEKQNFGMKSRLALFKDVIQSTGAEFVVSGKVIRILDKVGTDLSTIVKKGFNLQDLRLEHDIGSFITYKKGFGAFKDPDNESKGRLTVSYESPLAQTYGRLEGEPVVDERYTVRESLLTRIKNDVENSYQVSIELDITDLQSAGYKVERPRAGDYIMAINDDVGFRDRVRIMSFTSSYDINDEIVDHTITLNSMNMANRQATHENSWQANVEAGLENVKEKVNEALVSADGKNIIFYGEDIPKATKNGDMWYKPVGEDTILYVWNGQIWQETLSTKENTLIKENINQMEKEVQEAKEKANQSAIDTISAKNSADEAIKSAVLAKEHADSAISNAASAILNAKEALEQAKIALNDSENSKTIISNLQIEVAENTGEIRTKADRKDVSILKNIVTNQGTQLAQTENEIKTKAEKSSVDILNQMVQKQETEITQNANAIKLKAEQQDVVGLKNDFDNLEVGNRNLIIKTTANSAEALPISDEGSMPCLLKNIPDKNGYYWRVKEKITIAAENIGDELFYAFNSMGGGKHALENGKKYTFSVSVDSDAPKVKLRNRIFEFGYWRDECFDLEKKQRAKVTFTVPSNARAFLIYIQAYNEDNTARLKNSYVLNFEYPCLVLGTNNYNWTPAPEDLDQSKEVVQLASSFDVQANQIKSLVTKTDNQTTQLSSMTQETNRISSIVSDIQGNTINMQSQITQLSDNILLRVSKNDLINQINISTEGILIDGKKVHITGKTMIDNAVIKSAMIDTVSANKLTAGTIDANQINLINLNANNISSGYIDSNLIKSNSITVNKLKVYSLSGISADLGVINAGTINGVVINGAKFNGGIYQFDDVVTTDKRWTNGYQETMGSITKYGMFYVTDAFNYNDRNYLEDVFMVQLVKHGFEINHYTPHNNKTEFARIGWSRESLVYGISRGEYTGKPYYYAHAKDPKNIAPPESVLFN